MEVIRGRKKKQKQIISAKEQKNYYLCNKTTRIGVNRVVEFKCIFFVIYTASSDYQEHFVDSSYQVSIPHFILKELTKTCIDMKKAENGPYDRSQNMGPNCGIFGDFMGCP